MNGISYDSTGVGSNKNTLMCYACKPCKSGNGVWFEIFEVGCIDPCASIFMSIPDLKALSAYTASVAQELERECATMRSDDEPVRICHEYDPNVKHIDEY